MLLRRGEKRLTMIHLDSLTWQIAMLSDAQREVYFSRLGALDVWHELQTFLVNQTGPVASVDCTPKLSGKQT